MAEDKRTRRHFTSEEKARAVTRHVMGGEQVSAICEDLDIAPNLLYRWQKELFDHASAAFEVKGRGKRGQNPSHKLEQANAKLRAKLTHKDNVIAEITQEYVALKKSLGED